MERIEREVEGFEGIEMIHSAEEFIRLRTSQDPELYTRAARDFASENVWMDIIRNHPEMRVWVVANKTVPDTILKLLADDPDPGVREFVARKRKAGALILEKLSKDVNDSVRLAVACNKSTPPAILNALAHDDWGRVAHLARKRLKASAGESA